METSELWDNYLRINIRFGDTNLLENKTDFHTRKNNVTDVQ